MKKLKRGNNAGQWSVVCCQWSVVKIKKPPANMQKAFKKGKGLPNTCDVVLYPNFNRIYNANFIIRISFIPFGA